MKIGKIISVEYDKFRVRLFNTTKTSTVTIDGKVYYFGNIGSYLKTNNSSGDSIICEVVSIVDWINKDGQVTSNYNLDTSREIIIKPVGTLKNDNFSMGVGIFPSLYSDVEIVTFQDLDKILQCNCDCEEEGVHTHIQLGLSKSLINYPIQIAINRLFNIHTAVLGNSGSGKSNTIAHLIQEIFRKENFEAKGGKFIIFDSNGEYWKAFSTEADFSQSVKTVYLKPNALDGDAVYKPFHLPYYLMNLDKWLSFLMASDRTQKPFWDNVLQETYKFYKIINSDKEEELKKSPTTLSGSFVKCFSIL